MLIFPTSVSEGGANRRDRGLLRADQIFYRKSKAESSGFLVELQMENVQCTKDRFYALFRERKPPVPSPG